MQGEGEGGGLEVRSIAWGDIVACAKHRTYRHSGNLGDRSVLLTRQEALVPIKLCTAMLKFGGKFFAI